MLDDSRYQLETPLCQLSFLECPISLRCKAYPPLWLHLLNVKLQPFPSAHCLQLTIHLVYLLKYQGVLSPSSLGPQTASHLTVLIWAKWFLIIQPKLSSKSLLFRFLGIHEQECMYFHKMYISKSNFFYYPFCRIFTQSKLIHAWTTQVFLSHSSPNNHGSSFEIVSQAAPLYYWNLPRAGNAPIIITIIIVITTSSSSFPRLHKMFPPHLSSHILLCLHWQSWGSSKIHASHLKSLLVAILFAWKTSYFHMRLESYFNMRLQREDFIYIYMISLYNIIYYMLLYIIYCTCYIYVYIYIIFSLYSHMENCSCLN